MMGDKEIKLALYRPMVLKVVFHASVRIALVTVPRKN